MDIGPFNIGEYLPGGHFGNIHSERTSINTLHRLFAFMTYLNDVEDGGHTMFPKPNIWVKPRAGRLLMFPPFWTHEHRGVTLQKGVKYIATTWIVFK